MEDTPNNSLVRFPKGFQQLDVFRRVIPFTKNPASLAPASKKRGFDAGPAPEHHLSHAQNPVLKWSTQNHASRNKKADIRNYFWRLPLTNLHLPRF